MGDVRNSIGTISGSGATGGVEPAIARAVPTREAYRGSGYRESFDVY